MPDRREATIETLRQASCDHDLILTSGGVSVGEEDHIKPAVESLGRLDLLANRHEARQTLRLRHWWARRISWACRATRCPAS